MQRKQPQIDVINEILEDCLMAFPIHSLLISLYQQYQRRGFLTKKQLQALHIKATQVATMQHGKLATLEAIINKMPNRFKSELPEVILEQDDSAVIKVIIENILQKYPLHKRVIFFQSKIDNNEQLSPKEIEELKKFEKIALR